MNRSGDEHDRKIAAPTTPGPSMEDQSPVPLAGRRLTAEEIDAFAASIGTGSVIDSILGPIGRWAEVVSTVYGWMLVIAACVMLLRAIYERDLGHLWSEAGLPIVVGAAVIWWVVRWVARRSR